MPPTPALPVASRPATASATILLVAEHRRRAMGMARVLERHGFQVLTAAHAGHAVLASLQHEGRIDLLLTDLTTPGSSGRDLAARLARRRPDLRALFLTGALDPPTGDDDCLPARLSSDILVTAVRQALA
jgi:CheY-like chemotaxis protein